MLAIGRALMAKPKLLLLDEPSMGLAPKIVEQILENIRAINQSGVTVLLVEQNAAMALAISHRGYVLETGQVILSGASSDLAGIDRATGISAASRLLKNLTCFVALDRLAST